MTGSDDNNPGVIGPPKMQGGFHAGIGKLKGAAGSNRRALSNIDKNIIGCPPYLCASNKRVLCEKQTVISEKILPAPVYHRPITRKFAAQLSIRQQQKEEEIRRPSDSVEITVESDDSSIVDVEEYRPLTDTSVPIFVQHTEAMLEEIDRMQEVEMEDVGEEDDLVVDIDCSDKKNPLAVVEYVDDLYAFYRKTEHSSCVPPNYMTRQHDINERMRGILMDWLIEVHYKFELMDETLYLTVNLIDRFLAVHPVVRKRLQLVGVTAMLLACKYEEVSVPVVDDLILISDRAYNRREVLDMEKLMVNTLQFKLSVPTPYVFMRRFLKASSSDPKLELLAFFIIELSLVEYKMLKFPPSVLAAAAIFTAQSTLTGCKQWSKSNEWYTNYTEEQLLECSRLMVAYHQNAATGKLTGVHRKYNTSKFGFAAQIRPASFLLNVRFF